MRLTRTTRDLSKFYSYRQYCTRFVCVLFFGLAQPAVAEWTGGVEGGTVVSDAGNANRIRLVLQNNETPFSQYLYAEWLRGGDGGNSYALGYNPRLWLDEKNYIFGESEFRKNDSLGIDQEVRVVGGVGRQFIATEEQGLNVELGLGLRSIEYDTADESEAEALAVARVGYIRTIADTVKLDFKFNGTQSAEESTEATAELGVSLRLPQGSVRLAYRSVYYKFGDLDAVTDGDSFVSFGYSF